MIYGIIDIGSNAIRLSLFELVKDELKLLTKNKVLAGLASYVEDDSITQEGIDKACEVVKSYKDVVDRFNIQNVLVLATASLRNVKNGEEAAEAINKTTRFKVEILSGEEEAYYDFKGAIHSLDMNDGVLIDIGGGSTEIVLFKDKEVIIAFSMPIGCLNFYANYVNGLIPTEEERNQMKDVTLQELNKIQDIKSYQLDKVCGVGGTVKAAIALNNKLFGDNKETIKVSNIQRVLNKLNNQEKPTLNKIIKVVPDRIHTIIPGMVILDTITQYFNSKEIYLSKYGVGEGYLFSKLGKNNK